MGQLIQDIAHSLYFCKQVIVLSLVYIERLLEQRESMYLTTGNWRSLVVVTLLIASKVWEDVHPWNADFENCLWDIAGIRYHNGALYRLESLFLHRLRWRVFISGETYAAYYFTLAEDSLVENEIRPSRSRLVTEPAAFNSCFETIPEETLASEWLDLEDGASRGFANSRAASPAHSDENRGVLSSRVPIGALPRRRSSSRSNASSPSPIASPRERSPASVRRIGHSHFSAKNIHEAWRLDKSNPHIGLLRHAPRALAPSKHIRQSADFVWEHHVATQTADAMLGPSRKERDAVTLSGATGAELALELRVYLDQKKAHADAGEQSCRTGVLPRSPGGTESLEALFE